MRHTGSVRLVDKYKYAQKETKAQCIRYGKISENKGP
jgi:hypothetical protein